MRGDTTEQSTMLVASPADALVPDDHPIRRLGRMVERALARLSPRFEAMDAAGGRPLDPARAPAEGEPTARALVHPLGAAVL